MNFFGKYVIYDISDIKSVRINNIEDKSVVERILNTICLPIKEGKYKFRVRYCEYELFKFSLNGGFTFKDVLEKLNMYNKEIILNLKGYDKNVDKLYVNRINKKLDEFDIVLCDWNMNLKYSLYGCCYMCHQSNFEQDAKEELENSGMKSVEDEFDESEDELEDVYENGNEYEYERECDDEFKNIIMYKEIYRKHKEVYKKHKKVYKKHKKVYRKHKEVCREKYEKIYDILYDIVYNNKTMVFDYETYKKHYDSGKEMRKEMLKELKNKEEEKEEFKLENVYNMNLKSINKANECLENNVNKVKGCMEEIWVLNMEIKDKVNKKRSNELELL